MNAVNFEQSNCYFGPPPDMAASQVAVIHAYRGTVERGSCEGVGMVITAWKPDEQDLRRLNAGEPIFLTFLGGLPPHMVTTHFDEARNPA